MSPEHGYAGAQAILTGGNYASYLVWDGIRGLDYLSERMSQWRVCCTGTSGGGLQAELRSQSMNASSLDPGLLWRVHPDNPTRPGLTMADIDVLIAPRPR